MFQFAYEGGSTQSIAVFGHSNINISINDCNMALKLSGYILGMINGQTGSTEPKPNQTEPNQNQKYFRTNHNYLTMQA